MNTIKVNLDAYKGSGWAVSLIRNHAVIAAEYVDYDRLPTNAQLVAAIEALKASEAYRGAKIEADTAYAALEADDGEDDEVTAGLNTAFEAASIRIRAGMMSATQFHVDFDRDQRRRLGIPANLHI